MVHAFRKYLRWGVSRSGAGLLITGPEDIRDHGNHCFITIPVTQMDLFARAMHGSTFEAPKQSSPPQSSALHVSSASVYYRLIQKTRKVVGLELTALGDGDREVCGSHQRAADAFNRFHHFEPLEDLPEYAVFPIQMLPLT